MAGKGIQFQPIRIPSEWDPVWFESVFIKDVLAKLDPRNAIEGTGISITGQSSEPATIAASEDLSQLFDADFLLAEPTALLPNARMLTGEYGVISVDDAGPGSAVTIGIEPHGLELGKLAQISPLSVLGNDSASPADVHRIASSDDDTLLRRVAGVLEWGQLTVDMAPDGLWPYAKLDAGVQASLDLADSALQDAPSDNATYGRQNASWVPVNQSTVGLFGTWQWSPGNTTPAWGQVSTGAETNPSLATEVIFNNTDRSGQNFAGIGALVDAGSTLYAQSIVDPTAWVKYEVTGPGTPVTGDAVSFPVMVLDSGPGSVAGWSDVNVLLNLESSGGGGTVDSVQPGFGVLVDATDPANPEVAVDQAMVPTWTGKHTFSAGIWVQQPNDPEMLLYGYSNAANEKYWVFAVNGAAKTFNILTYDDTLSTQSLALSIVRAGIAITGMVYGNATDKPKHTFYGAAYFLTALGVPSFASNGCVVGAGASGGKLKFIAASGGTNAKTWEFATSSSILVLRSVDDVDNNVGTALSVSKSGYALTDITIGNSTDNAPITFAGIHNNSGGNLRSGTYTPSITAVSGFSTSTARVCQWMRVGNVVTVSGTVSLTASATSGSFAISLPIASNLASVSQLGGMVFGPAFTRGGSLYADATNDRATSGTLAPVIGTEEWSFHFTYLVV